MYTIIDWMFLKLDNNDNSQSSLLLTFLIFLMVIIYIHALTNDYIQEN
jgi:hypothetical protein